MEQSLHSTRFDDETIRRAARGDHEAFRHLVESNQSLVRGVLMRLTGFDGARADDLAQEVFLLAFRRLSTFRFESSLSTWLYRMAYNVFIDDQRKNAARFAGQNEVSELVGLQPQIVRDYDQLDLQRALEKAMAELRVEERTALVFTIIEELTHEEAAQIMGVALGTLKTHVLRGKEQLKVILQKSGWEVAL
jgi:RNA polymerase sigma factor (sigma-70 family)